MNIDIGLISYTSVLTNPFFIILAIIPGLFIAAWLYDKTVSFCWWIARKYALLMIGIALLKAKDKLVRDIGWQTIKLVFWESN